MSIDYKSPEFWIASIGSIAAAVVAILVARGLLSEEEGQLWLQLAVALVGPIAVIVIGVIANGYVKHMTAIRTSRIMAGRE